MRTLLYILVLSAVVGIGLADRPQCADDNGTGDCEPVHLESEFEQATCATAIAQLKQELSKFMKESAQFYEETRENDRKRKRELDGKFRRISKTLNTLDRKINDVNEEITKMRCHIKTTDRRCFFIIVHAQQDLMYKDALSLCHSEDADVARIPDKETYDLIMDNLRKKIPYMQDSVPIWSGIKINTTTGEVLDPVTHPYIHWSDGYPNLRSDIQRDVYLFASDGTHSEGMGNVDAWTSFNGIVCQRNN